MSQRRRPFPASHRLSASRSDPSGRVPAEGLLEFPQPDHLIAELRSVPAFHPGRASVGPRSFGKVTDGRQGSAGSSSDPIGLPEAGFLTSLKMMLRH